MGYAASTGTSIAAASAASYAAALLIIRPGLFAQDVKDAMTDDQYVDGVEFKRLNGGKVAFVTANGGLADKQTDYNGGGLAQSILFTSGECEPSNIGLCIYDENDRAGVFKGVLHWWVNGVCDEGRLFFSTEMGQIVGSKVADCTVDYGVVLYTNPGTVMTCDLMSHEGASIPKGATHFKAFCVKCNNNKECGMGGPYQAYVNGPAPGYGVEGPFLIYDDKTGSWPSTVVSNVQVAPGYGDNDGR